MKVKLTGIVEVQVEVETEIWMTAPLHRDGDILTAEFVEAEMLDD